MFRTSFFILGILLLTNGVCTAPAEVPEGSVLDEIGTIEQHTNGEWLIRLESDASFAYAVTGALDLPDGNLPNAFKREGMRVRFNGEELDIPPEVRLWGVPLRLTEIEPLPR